MEDGYAALEQDHRDIEEHVQELLRDDESPVVRELGELLVRHFQREEAALHPLVRRYVDGGDDLADRAVAEHATIATMMAELSDSATPERMGALLADLGGAIAAHVEFVEAEVFPAMQSCAVDGAQLGRTLEGIEH